MGGLGGAGLCARRVFLRRRLVLVNTVFDRSPQERAAVEARVREVLSGGHGGPASRRRFERCVHAGLPAPRGGRDCAAFRRRMEPQRSGGLRAAYGLFATADRELAGRIGDIMIPTTVVNGRLTTGVRPRRWRWRCAERLPRGRCHIIPGQRHMTPLEVPDLVAALIAGRPLAADTHIAAQ